MSQLEAIKTNHAPQAIGPYSQAIKCGNFVFVSGQVPLHPETGEVVGDTIESQSERVMQNLKGVLQEIGGSWNQVVKTSVFLTDLGMFQRFNDVYAKYFSEHKPARACVEVSALPKGVMVEIEMIVSL